MKRLLFIALLLYGSYAPAQEQPPEEVRDSVKIHFRQGHSAFDPLYRGNGEALKAFASRLQVIRRDSLCRIRSIRIVGGASPEGNTTLNKQLSEKRAEHIFHFLQQQISLDGIPLDIDSRGIDWQGLTELVEKSDMPYRDEVLNILRNTPEWITRGGVVVDGRKRQLGMLHGGQAWNYMYEHFFPTLRGSGVKLVCEVERLAPPVIETKTEMEPPLPQKDTVTVLKTDTVLVRDTVYIPSCPDKPFYMDVRTNMPYDLLAVPNVGVEFYLGKDWSVATNWMYAWWKTDRRHRYWRVYGGDLALRKWFGKAARRKPLTGHHVGVYGQVLTYDFEWGGKGHMAGEPGGDIFDRANYAVGLEYGYSLPVARRLNIDFTVGAGYMGGKYYEYEPVDGCYVWQDTKQRHWWGPTKMEVSLVWLLGRGNFNSGKGGGE
mgnify:FL=1